ncbi:ATP-binding protein [Phenylobacterium immobile]|uniref:ATP-binding protein n=1 Tax=Phenylobacterium immobile TaxID=21 RepID=UPI000AF4A5DE|nr:ATP-binding protein [Phenylobacterium immobile]
MSQPSGETAIDLDACAAEPIRIPGGVQPHGALLITAFDGAEVLHVSANLADAIGVPLTAGDRLDTNADLALLAAELTALGPRDPVLARTLRVSGHMFHVSAHATHQGVIVEFEDPPASEDQTLAALYPRLRRFMDDLAGAADVTSIAEAAVNEVWALTGFNRVLLYSFDARGVGAVLAEASDGVLPSYLNLKFPAADIPAQARELYKLSRIRLIPTADYQPAPLIPAISPIDGAPVDLSRAALRSVSPVHLEYMRNMGTASSMSISIVVEGELWGLISGHSAAPRAVNPQVRSACDHLGQILSLQIEARELARRSSERLRLSEIQGDLLTQVAAATAYDQGLAENPEAWMAVGGGAGAALVGQDRVISVGVTPPADAILDLARRLAAESQREVALESIADAWPDAQVDPDEASGLLAVSISQLHPDYLMWFRPQALRTVNWAGEPAKAVEIGERLHPRQSFELWKEQVRLRALPWTAEEIDSARRFRAAIQNFVLRRAEERAELTNRLAETNRELESFSYSISHDLRAPFRHVAGFADLLAERVGQSIDATSRHYLATIRDSALTAGRLVDDLLAFSQLGRNSLAPGRVDVQRLVQDVRRSLASDVAGRRITWKVDSLPSAWADPAMLRQVFVNLLDNAIKYTRGRDPAVISITGEDLPTATRYTVRDNGAGFDAAYTHKLFAVFQRLHRAEEFEGTGIGLALVRRIAERHGGSVSATGTQGEGASFTIVIPKRATAVAEER